MIKEYAYKWFDTGRTCSEISTYLTDCAKNGFRVVQMCPGNSDNNAVHFLLIREIPDIQEENTSTRRLDPEL